MYNLSRDVFGNVSFTKQLKENKSFFKSVIKIHYNYDCIDYNRFISFGTELIKISLN